MVELEGIEPSTSSTPKRRSARQPLLSTGSRRVANDLLMIRGSRHLRLPALLLILDGGQPRRGIGVLVPGARYVHYRRGIFCPELQ